MRGPPGTGKTSLVMVIASRTQSHFETLSAVLAGDRKEQGLAELRVGLGATEQRSAQERRKLDGKRTILFVQQVVETRNWA